MSVFRVPLTNDLVGSGPLGINVQLGNDPLTDDLSKGVDRQILNLCHNDLAVFLLFADGVLLLRKNTIMT